LCSLATGKDIVHCEVEGRCLDLGEDRIIFLVHIAATNVPPHIRPEILRHGVRGVVILREGGGGFVSGQRMMSDQSVVTLC
jgi:hypothetical protein